MTFRLWRCFCKFGSRVKCESVNLGKRHELLCDHDQSPSTRLHPNNRDKIKHIHCAQRCHHGNISIYIFVDPKSERLFTTSWHTRLHPNNRDNKKHIHWAQRCHPGNISILIYIFVVPDSEMLL